MEESRAIATQVEALLGRAIDQRPRHALDRRNSPAEYVEVAWCIGEVPDEDAFTTESGYQAIEPGPRQSQPTSARIDSGAAVLGAV